MAVRQAREWLTRRGEHAVRLFGSGMHPMTSCSDCASGPSGTTGPCGGGLLGIIEAAVREDRTATPADILTEVRRLGLTTPSEVATADCGVPIANTAWG